jgi:hypothetical protein
MSGFKRRLLVFGCLLATIALLTVLLGGPPSALADMPSTAPMTQHAITARGAVTDDKNRQPLAVGAETVTTTLSHSVEVVGQIGGRPTAVAVQGHHAYLTSGPRLVILDVSDPARPLVIGRSPLLPRNIAHLAVSGTYAYVTDQVTLWVVDVANPALPAVVGSYATAGPITSVALAGSHAYLTEAERGLSIINIADPTHPVLVAQYDTPLYAEEVVVRDGYAYVADRSSFLVMNVANPAAPLLVSSLQGFWSVQVALAGDYAYLVNGSSPTYLQVVNIANPASPARVGSYESQQIVRDLAVVNTTVYLVGWYWSLRVVDAATPTAPVEVGVYDTPTSGASGSAGVAAVGDHVYIASGGLHIVNISTPATPREVGVYNTTSEASDVAVWPRPDLAGRLYAYVADRLGGLDIIDVTNPISLTEAGFYEQGGLGATTLDALSVAVSDTYAAVAGGDSGAYIFDVTNPQSPTLTSRLQTPPTTGDVAVAGEYAYFGTNYYSGHGLVGGSLEIVDVSPPANPTRVGSLDTGPAHAVAVAGDWVYLAGKAIDVSNPALPWAAGPAPVGGFDMSVAGDYLYVVDGELQINTIITPSQPVPVGALAVPDSISGVAVSGTLAYLANGSRGLRVIDVTNPALPVEVGFYKTPGAVESVAVFGDKVYVAAQDGGLWILRFTGRCYDFVGPSSIGVEDLLALANRWLLNTAQGDPDNNPATPNYEARFDLDRDGTIEVSDLLTLTAQWGRVCD